MYFDNKLTKNTEESKEVLNHQNPQTSESSFDTKKMTKISLLKHGHFPFTFFGGNSELSKTVQKANI